MKLIYSLMLAVIIPVYWHKHGPANFLWFSDIALLAMLLALWLENALIASMMAVGVLPFEAMWLIDFLTGGPMGLADYMFGAGNMPVYLRVLSGFHFILPVVIIYSVYTLGYDKRALPAQIILALIILPLTYYFTVPSDNINWVYGLDGKQETMHPLLYLGLLMTGMPLLIHIPMHYLLTKVMPSVRTQPHVN